MLRLYAKAKRGRGKYAARRAEMKANGNERKFCRAQAGRRVSRAKACLAGLLCRRTAVRSAVRKENAAFLTIKGRHWGFSREEFEYESRVMPTDVDNALALPSLIDKIRHKIPYRGLRLGSRRVLGTTRACRREIELTDRASL